jgi:hypothetical protein
MAHFSVVSLTQVVLLLVFICWTPSSTGAAFSLEEEEFLQLKEIIYHNLFSRDASVLIVRFNLLFLMFCNNVIPFIANRFK